MRSDCTGKKNGPTFFLGSDQANLLKFNQIHPNNRHFESLNRYFQEENCREREALFPMFSRLRLF